MPYLINIDPDDFPALFRNKGMAIILAGESGDADGDINEHVVRQCLNSPSFDIDYRSATGCIVLITAGQQFKRDDTGKIVSLLTNELDPTADVVWCSNKNTSMNGRVQVYGIMTGIQYHFSGGNNPETKEHGKDGENHMKVSSESSLTDRILVYSWVLVSDFRPYSEALHKKIDEIPGYCRFRSRVYLY